MGDKSGISGQPCVQPGETSGQNVNISQAKFIVPPVISEEDARHFASPMPSSLSSKRIHDMLSPDYSNENASKVVIQSNTSISDQVHNAIFNQSFIEKMVEALLTPIQCIVTEIVQNAINDNVMPMISAQVNGSIKNYPCIAIELAKQNDLINKLQSKIDELEKTQEEQQQYSRRTCLKFLRVPVPEGESLADFDALNAVIHICKNLFKK